MESFTITVFEHGLQAFFLDIVICYFAVQFNNIMLITYPKIKSCDV